MAYNERTKTETMNKQGIIDGKRERRKEKESNKRKKNERKEKN